MSYQRDVLGGGALGHTYKVGLAGGQGPLAAGFGGALYRGGTKGTGFDMGLTYHPSPVLRIGGAIQNVREPTGRGAKPATTFGPGGSLEPVGAVAASSADPRAAT